MRKYEFKKWEDGSTNPTRTLNVTKDMEITAYYKEVDGTVSYLQVPIKIDAILEYRVVGPSDTKPTPAAGYTIDPDPIEISGVTGKFWIEYKIV